jgi:hypothetical protein
MFVMTARLKPVFPHRTASRFCQTNIARRQASGDTSVFGFQFASSVCCATIVVAALAGLSSRGEAGLIALWEFQDNVVDSTGTYNATAVNGPTYAPGMIGQAISLNGVNQAATVPDMGTYANATVSVWVNTRNADSPVNQAIFHSTAYTNGTPHFLLEYVGSSPSTSITGLVIDVPTAGEVKLNGVNSPISENTWYNIVYSYDQSGQSMMLYLDGVSVGSAGSASMVALNLNSMVIGAENTAGTSRSFNGLLDDLGVWNESLSATKVKGIYSFATFSLFNYGQDDVALLYGLTADQSTTLSDGVDWGYATGLTGALGVVESLGGGLYAMNLGNGTGVRTVSPVPEPSTYCIVLTGLTCGGYTMFRRRKPVLLTAVENGPGATAGRRPRQPT